MLVVKEKPIVAREETPLFLGKPLVTKGNPLLPRKTHCCYQGNPLLLGKLTVVTKEKVKKCTETDHMSTT